MTNGLQAAKQEEWEEKTKLANQFRALEEDEIMFLDSVREKQEEEERERKERDGEELKSFRESVHCVYPRHDLTFTRRAVAAKVVVKSPPPVPSTSSAPKPPNQKALGPLPNSLKKDSKKSLKGVVVKKKPKPSGDSKSSILVANDSAPSADDTGAVPSAKRRKVVQSDS